MISRENLLEQQLREKEVEIKRLKEEYMILQNASDEVEEEKDKEIERLKEMKLHTEKYASEMEDKYILEKNKNDKGIEAINVYQNGKTLSIGYEDLKRIRGILQGNEFDLRMFEEYLQELKGSDKE